MPAEASNANLDEALEEIRHLKAGVRDELSERVVPPLPQGASGLTYQELWLRIGGDRATLWRVLRNEVQRGRIGYDSTSKRYVLTGGLPADVKRALLDLGLVDDRR